MSRDRDNAAARPADPGLTAKSAGKKHDQRGQLAAAEQATERANQRLRETLERIEASFFAFDADWKLVYVNQRASDLWRVPLMDRLGERLWEVSPGWDESAFGRKVLAAVAGDGPDRFDHWNQRLQRWLDVRVYSGDDGVSLYAEDVTERRRQEFRQVFLADASAVLAGSLDLDTTLQSVAALSVEHLADFCVVDSISEPGRISRTAMAHHDPAQQERLVRFRERYPFDHEADFGPGLAFRTGQLRLYETIDEQTQEQIRQSDDRLDEFLALGFRSVIVAPMVSRGIVQGVISLVSNTPGHFKPADVALAEELARRAGVAIDNARLYLNAQATLVAREHFLSAAAHELRTPITAIGGFAGLLQREASGNNNPDRVLRYVKRLSDAAGRLNVLVEDMLDVSRMRSGQILLRPQRFDLAELIHEIIERVVEQHLSDQLRIGYQGPESGGWLVADSDRVEQVLSNVLDNAIKYSPPDGAIEVRLESLLDGWEVAVEDHGIGIPEGAAELIFEPFGRAANARAANVAGLGIGLSISRGIIERHGGTIWAESNGEGGGTTMRFRLPTQPLN